MKNTEKQRCGFAAIIGYPNAGKSTFLNHALGTKISITSNKVDTTRYCIHGVVTENQYQLVLMDTPGFSPSSPLPHALSAAMQKTVRQALIDADVILWIVDANTLMIHKDKHEALYQCFPKKPIFLLVNKVDLCRQKDKLSLAIEELISVCAIHSSFNISAKYMSTRDFLPIGAEVKKQLPEQSFLFDEDMLTDRSTRFIVNEYIREKLHRLLGHELPYQVAVDIDQFKESNHAIEVCATIYVAKSSHKPMIIGHKGQKIKMISIAAREDMEKFLQKKVVLKLWVKEKSGWIQNHTDLTHLGILISSKSA